MYVEYIYTIKENVLDGIIKETKAKYCLTHHHHHPQNTL